MPEDLPLDVSSDEVVSTPVRAHNVFSHHDTHPIILDLLLIDGFGKDWWAWDAETLWDSIRSQLGPRLTRGGDVNLSELNKNKVQAIKTLHASDGYWNDWETFTVVTQPLANNLPRFDVLQEPTLPQLMTSVDISTMVAERPFSEEVARFVAAAALYQGVWFLPPPLEFAQPFASRPRYRCNDCGNEDVDDLEDGICDACAGRFRGSKNLDGKPSPDSAAVVLGEGRNIERYLLNDPAPVQKRYEEVANLPLDQIVLQETSIDVCVARVLVARDYMDIRRRQLKDQLEVLRPWIFTH